MATSSVRIHDEDAASIPSAADYKRLRFELADAVSFIKSHGETFAQLGALFEAINAGGTRVDELAGAGRYLADDWANVADAHQEELQQALIETPNEPPHWMVDKDCECPDCLVQCRLDKAEIDRQVREIVATENQP